MDPREAVMMAARLGVEADTAEDGFREIQTLTGSNISERDLAEALAAAVSEGLLRDPVRLLPGHLHCCWKLELAPGKE